MSQVLLTGIKPTGGLHVGNYAGMIKPLLLQTSRNDIDKAICFIADVHALNGVQDSVLLKNNVRHISAALIALGIKKKNIIFFRQSAVREHLELAMLLVNVTQKGLMNRAHSYKSLTSKNLEKKLDPDHGVNMGLFTYPILMAADILLYQSTIVPVGRDQRQHIEFTHDIAERFNRIYGSVFTLPNYDEQNPGPEIIGLDGRKMSKSYNNTIEMFLPEDELRKKIGKISTDSKSSSEPKDPETSTIFQIYSLFSTDEEISSFRKMFLNGGLSYKEAKDMLFVKMNEFMQEPRYIYEDIMRSDNLSQYYDTEEAIALAAPFYEFVKSKVFCE